MLKQERNMIIRIDDDLKDKFKLKCDENYQTLSARIKFLINKDITNNLIIK